MPNFRLAASVLLLILSPLSASGAQFRPNGLVVLMTDFGSGDFYVGAMKGAILRTSQSVRIEEITHEVPKYDVAAGAYILAMAAAEFPKGTVFLCVVDPGVGTARKPVAVVTSDGNVFVGPDNGLFTRIIDGSGLQAAYELTNPDLIGKDPISSTFHGKDVFGPVAAFIASGVPIEKVGPRLDDLVRLQPREPRVEGGWVVGEVTVVDHYGNLLTNIRRKDLERVGIRSGDTLKMSVGPSELVLPLMKTYADVPVGSPVCVIGSGDVLEAAINQGNLGESFNARTGDPVRVERKE